MIITTKNMFTRANIFLWLGFSCQVFAGSGHGEQGHDDHHGHSDEPALVYTHYSNSTELFLEFPPLVVNQPSTFIAHFTRLDNFRPLTSGVLNIHLKQDGKSAARFRVKAPARKGIFLPDVRPKKTGKYQLLMEVRDGDLHALHDLGEVTVFADNKSVRIEQEKAEGEISYLKEQQWINPFAITQIKHRALRPSVPGFGTVMAPADGYAVVRAPSNGYYSSETFLNAGENVKADQALGTLIPRLGEGSDIGNLLVNQQKTRAQYQLAQSDLNRLQALFEQGAIPEKRLQQARQALEIARVELQTSRSRLQQLSGEKSSGKNSAAGIALRAPISGELVDVSVRPGGYLHEGEAMFSIANRDRRWLNIQVPEKFGIHVPQASGAWLYYDNQALVLDSSTGAQVVKTSQQIDPLTRTLSAAIEYPSHAGPALIGSRLEAHVYIAEAQALLAIPSSALIDDGGQPVVYVQSAGETFARRPIKTGIQDGPWVQVLSGVKAGEWIVTKGAYYIKLASTGGDAIGHGHAH